MAKSEDFSITVDRDIPAEMSDGVLLRSDIYRPIKAVACPVLLCRTPYDKGQDTYIQIARALASNGYIAVVQDIRGRGISDGEYFWQFQNNAETFDAQDGYDTVEWASEYPRQRRTDWNMGTFLPVVVHLASRRNAAALAQSVVCEWYVSAAA